MCDNQRNVKENALVERIFRSESAQIACLRVEAVAGCDTVDYLRPIRSVEVFV
jgi:predicted aminopeptidase